MEQFFPIVGPHDYDGKVTDLRGLNQGKRFEKLVERARAAGHDNESIGIFNEKRFADEKIMQSHAAIEIRICWLLRRQFDGAPDRTPTSFLSAPVRSFHDTRATTGDDGEAKPRNGCTHFSGELVIGIAGLDSGRAKNGHAWADKMKSAKTTQEIAHHFQEGEKLFET